MNGFTPGERLTVLETKTRQNEPISSHVDVLVPARLHLSVIDMNRFAVGRFGGGWIGMSADIKINVSVSTTSSETARLSLNAKRSFITLQKLFADRSATTADYR